jgi:hypothetical protein
MSQTIRRIWDRWCDFWFRPDDPTLLGCIRVLTGMIAFYVVLAYSVDLQEILGRDAWLDHESIEAYRKEAPVFARSNTWTEGPRTMPPTGASEREYLEQQSYIDRWGVHPKLTLAKGQPIWSVWFHVTDPTWMVIVHVGILAVLFLFTMPRPCSAWTR